MTLAEMLARRADLGRAKVAGATTDNPGYFLRHVASVAMDKVLGVALVKVDAG
jgi:C4-dicarboxylate-specific signal transduction histidine kinase